MNTKRMLKGILGLIFAAGLTASAWAAPAVVEKGTLTINDTYPSEYMDCIGEMGHTTITGTFEYHRVQRPNGEYVYHDLWLKDIHGMLYGDETGRVWVKTGKLSPYIEHGNAEDGTLGMMHFVAVCEFVGLTENTPTVEVHNVYHLSLDENGEVRLEFYKHDCR